MFIENGMIPDKFVEVRTELLMELYRALASRHVYQNAKDLPLGDLFHVGGKLSNLITKAESALSNPAFTFPDQSRYIFTNLIKDAKAFKKYIVNRLQKENL